VRLKPEVGLRFRRFALEKILADPARHGRESSTLKPLTSRKSRVDGSLGTLPRDTPQKKNDAPGANRPLVDMGYRAVPSEFSVLMVWAQLLSVSLPPLQGTFKVPVGHVITRNSSEPGGGGGGKEIRGQHLYRGRG